MNREAIAAYQAKKYEDARKVLKQALDLAAQAGLDKHPIKARTHIHFGIVAIVGFNQRDLGIKQFKKALEIQSDIGLTKSLVTPDLEKAFAEAKGGGAPPPPPPPPAEHRRRRRPRRRRWRSTRPDIARRAGPGSGTLRASSYFFAWYAATASRFICIRWWIGLVRIRASPRPGHAGEPATGQRGR